MAPPKKQLDSAIEIVTPENIAFRYQIAGPFRRLPAFAIDLAIRTGVWTIAAIGMAVAGVIVGNAGIALLFLLWFGLEWFYGGVFETYWNGQTPGKRAMGIRVVSIGGHPINGLQAFMRNILRGADMMPVVPLSVIDEELMWLAIPTFSIGLLCMILTKRFQRLGDITCGTMVVVDERSWLFGVTQLRDERVGRLAAELPVGFRGNRQLTRALASYVERRRVFSAARRREICRHLAEPLIERFELPADTDYDLLTCALYYREFVAEQPLSAGRPIELDATDAAGSETSSEEQNVAAGSTSSAVAAPVVEAPDRES